MSSSYDIALRDFQILDLKLETQIDTTSSNNLIFRLFYQSLLVPLLVAKDLKLLDCEKCSLTGKACKSNIEAGICIYSDFKDRWLLNTGKCFILPTKQDIARSTYGSIDESFIGRENLYEIYREYRKEVKTTQDKTENICIIPSVSYLDVKFFKLYLNLLPLCMKSAGFSLPGSIIILISQEQLEESQDILQEIGCKAINLINTRDDIYYMIIKEVS